MYSFLIVEDNIQQLLALKTMILDILPNEIVDTASTFNEAYQLITTKNYSVYFLDIQLSDNEHETGINLGKLIRTNKRTLFSPIIFTTTVTSAMKTALNELHCYNFLEKPFSSSDIKKILDEIIDNNICKSAPITFKDINNIFIQIQVDKIAYVYSKGHTTRIHCIDSVYELNRISLDKILKETGDSLIKCHRNYLINPAFASITDPNGNCVKVLSESIPISVRCENNLKGIIKNESIN